MALTKAIVDKKTGKTKHIKYSAAKETAILAERSNRLTRAQRDTEEQAPAIALDKLAAGQTPSDVELSALKKRIELL